MKGVYLLVVRVNKNLKLNIGSLGRVFFPKGVYVYVGSAQNNLQKRIERHISKRKKLFWHIDYLLNSRYAKVIKLLYKNAKKREECKLASKISKNGIPILRFGASDCNCVSHLFKINRLTALPSQMKEYYIDNMLSSKIKIL